MDTYLTIEDLALYLKVAEQTIRRWVLNKEIPYRKIKKVIRFRLSEIETWVDNGGVLIATKDVQETQDTTGELFSETETAELDETEVIADMAVEA